MNTETGFDSSDMTTIYIRKRSYVSYPLVPDNQKRKLNKRKKAIIKRHKQNKRKISHPAFYFEALRLLQSIGYK